MKKTSIIFLIIIFVLVCGCSKKQKVQEPQVRIQPSPTETKISKQTQGTVSEQSLYPTKQEKQSKPPLWFENLLSINKQYYEQWREKTSTDSSSVLIASLTSTGAVSGSTPSTISPQTISGSIPRTPAFTSIVRQSGTQPSIPSGSTSQSISVAASRSLPTSSPSSSQPPSSGGSQPSGSDGTPPTQGPPNYTGVSVIRSIQPFSGGAYIRLNVEVTDSRVNGIIVTENIPDSYSVASATPAISKRTGNSIKWLFYGTSLTNQTINYELRGAGKTTITGSFSSSFGSGSTTGDSQLGE